MSLGHKTICFVLKFVLLLAVNRFFSDKAQRYHVFKRLKFQLWVRTLDIIKEFCTLNKSKE